MNRCNSYTDSTVWMKEVNVLMDTCFSGIFIGGRMKKRSTRQLIIISLLSGIALVLMKLEIPLGFLVPGFIKLDFSEIPALIGAFTFGPVAGILIEAVKVILFAMTPSTGFGLPSLGIGELTNFILGVAFVVPASLVYFKKKTKKHAIQGMLLGTFTMAITAGLFNAFVALPTYARLYGTTLPVVVSWFSEINPWVDSVFTLVVFSIVPFNILKGLLVSFVVALIYKRISMIIKSKDIEKT